MILSDYKIVEELNDGELSVSPAPRSDQFQPASFDVRLGRKLYSVDRDETITRDSIHVLEPGEMYIGHTKDYIEMPNYLAAQLTGRSSVGRQGVVVHLTAGFIDPGFRGEITLEIYNFSNQARQFNIGQRVAQLVFFKVDGEVNNTYNGQFQGQTGPTHR